MFLLLDVKEDDLTGDARSHLLGRSLGYGVAVIDCLERICTVSRAIGVKVPFVEVIVVILIKS